MLIKLISPVYNTEIFVLYKYWPLFSGLVQLAFDYILDLCHVEFFPVAGADEHENWSREQQCAAWGNGKWLYNLLSGVFLLIIIANSKKITLNCMAALCKMSVEIKHEYNLCLVGWQMKCKVLLFVYWLPKHEMNDYLCLERQPKVSSGINLPVCDSFVQTLESWACNSGRFPNYFSAP